MAWLLILNGNNFLYEFFNRELELNLISVKFAFRPISSDWLWGPNWVFHSTRLAGEVLDKVGQLVLGGLRPWSPGLCLLVVHSYVIGPIGGVEAPEAKVLASRRLMGVPAKVFGTEHPMASPALQTGLGDQVGVEQGRAAAKTVVGDLRRRGSDWWKKRKCKGLLWWMAAETAQFRPKEEGCRRISTERSVARHWFWWSIRI